MHPPPTSEERNTTGSTLAPMLFNIYISDIPETVSTQYSYAHDQALLFSHKCRNDVQEVLSLDTQGITDYLSAWRLRLSKANLHALRSI